MKEASKNAATTCKPFAEREKKIPRADDAFLF